jgi:hypothetical protein
MRAPVAAGLCLLLSITGGTEASAHEIGEPDVALETVLSPHGDWLVVQPYGLVWRPSVVAVGEDFVPYTTGGRWEYTDLGWSFETVWEWGWLPFHYGRWATTEVGWVWVPGTEWAPAWVDWRMGGGYVGWAPLGPGATAAGTFGWSFVEERFFLEPDVYLYVVPVRVMVYVYRMTAPVRVVVRDAGRRWFRGPPAHRIAAAARVVVRPTPIRPPPPGRYVRPEHRPAPPPVIRRWHPTFRNPPVRRPRPQPPMIQPRRRVPPPPVIHRPPRERH